MWGKHSNKELFPLLRAQQPEHDIFSQTEQDTARNLGQWMSFFFFFFHSTLAHVCLHVHSVDAGFSHRAPSLSPDITYGSRLKALPAANPAAHFSPCSPLCPRQHPDLLLLTPAEAQILTASNNSSLEIPSFLHRQQ